MERYSLADNASQVMLLVASDIHDFVVRVHMTGVLSRKLLPMNNYDTPHSENSYKSSQATYVYDHLFHRKQAVQGVMTVHLRTELSVFLQRAELHVLIYL